MTSTRIAIAVAVAGLGLCAGAASGISAFQLDNFENGTTQGWSHGLPSPIPPFTVTEDGNTFVRVQSTGTGGPGSRMAAFNRQQWTGNYVSEDVTAIRFDVRNSGNNDLFVRLGLLNQIGELGVTNDVVELAANGDWVTATLNLYDLTFIGNGTVDGMLSRMLELRFVSAEFPAFEGDFVAGQLDIDNIRALPAPGGLVLAAVGGVLGGRRRRR